jgi:hypothetical protein
METVLTLIREHEPKIDGIKISLLDAGKEIEMRRLLPASVLMYTGDDFNYADLIAGDEKGFSHGLLGIFDPIAPAAAAALARLEAGDRSGFRAILDPTVAIATPVQFPPALQMVSRSSPGSTIFRAISA